MVGLDTNYNRLNLFRHINTKIYILMHRYILTALLVIFTIKMFSQKRTNNFSKTTNNNNTKLKNMKPNNIIFADLSTYTPKKTIEFYETIFNWKYRNYYDNYTAYLNDKPIVGLYETPEKFKQMRMPHFWMTYIQVNDIKGTVKKARELGGIIEMEQSLAGFGKVALIRDPQGAGFTIYEGNNLIPTRTKNSENTLIWNELHISNAKNIIPFYEGIFDWTFKPQKNNNYKIYNGKNEHIADALEISNEYKGKYEYWACTFGVKDLQKTKNDILQNGGTIVFDEGKRILFTDNSGEAFFYIKEVVKSTSTD